MYLCFNSDCNEPRSIANRITRTPHTKGYRTVPIVYYCTVLNHSLFTLIYIYFVVSAISKITFLEIQGPVSIRKIQYSDVDARTDGLTDSENFINGYCLISFRYSSQKYNVRSGVIYFCNKMQSIMFKKDKN